MCLILFAYRVHPGYRLILGANRDEFYARPTSPLAYWEDAPDILAGRDQQAGGTWLGVNRTGRFAAVTNYRDPTDIQIDAPSRGDLVSRFLTNTEKPGPFLKKLSAVSSQYNGFNLLVGSRNELWYYSNKGAEPRMLPPGVYGLSNHLLDTPWPKVDRGKRRFASIVAQEKWDEEAIFQLLSDRTFPPEESLPDTGVGLAWERILSTLFIESPSYGTRCSSILTIDAAARIRFVERTFAPTAAAGSGKTRAFDFDSKGAAG